MNLERRLAAILVADVVGYSRLMGDDEEGVHARLKKHRTEFIEPTIADYRGHIVKLTGDGALVEFPSVIDAVRCAVDVQRGMVVRNRDLSDNEQIMFRIGVNLGDVIDDDNDIYGDGVNIAARLEAVAPSGGICLSSDAFRQVEGKVDFGFEDLGDKALKNIAKPVRVYRVQTESNPGRTIVEAKHALQRNVQWSALIAACLIVLITFGIVGWRYYLQPFLQERSFVEKTALPLPDKPSIAVLPFTNMSGDPLQDYFSDGMTDSLITDLSGVSGLFVIARNSMFTYKGRPADVLEVGQELGVRYVLEGSFQRSDNRIRINAQLIDAATGYHLWTERFDQQLEDVFALQDQVADRIVSALQVELTDGEEKLRAQRYTDSIDAYDLFLRGREQYWYSSDETRLRARTFFERAIDIDPKFARAYANLALTYIGQSGGLSDLSHDRAFELVQKAIALDETLHQVHWAMTDVQMFRRQYAEALKSSQRATELDPNYADAYAQRAWLLMYMGKSDEALQTLDKAMRLNPHFPSAYLTPLGEIYFTLERYEEAIATFQEGLERNPDTQRQRMFLAASYAHAGRLDDAEWEIAELLALDTGFALDRVHEVVPYKDLERLSHLLDGLRKAGLT